MVGSCQSPTHRRRSAPRRVSRQPGSSLQCGQRIGVQCGQRIGGAAGPAWDRRAFGTRAGSRRWSHRVIPSARGRVSRRLSGLFCGLLWMGRLTLSPIANLFWNAQERRLRAGWRLLVFLVIVFLVAAVDGRVRAGLAGRLPRPL